MTSEFHKNFKKITKGETVTAIGKRTGLDRGSVSRYLRGGRQPGNDRLVQIAKAYNVSTDDLLGLTEDAA